MVNTSPPKPKLFLPRLVPQQLGTAIVRRLPTALTLNDRIRPEGPSSGGIILYDLIIGSSSESQTNDGGGMPTILQFND